MRTLIVDGNYMLYRTYFVPSSWELSHKDLKTGGTYVFLKSLHSALDNMTGITRVIVVWDGKRSSRRMELYPEYKGNRGEKISPEDRNELEEQKILLNRILPCLGVKTIRLPEREGDDVIYWLSRYCEGSVIMTEDKDMLAMINAVTSVYRPAKDETHTLESFFKDNGYLPPFYIYYKAALGDDSDNIDGVHGAGKVASTKFAQLLQEHRGNVDLVRTVLSASKAKNLKAISQQWDVVERNRKLVDCKFEQFTEEEILAMQNTVNEPVTQNLDLFVQLCDHYAFATLTGAAWLLPFRKLK